MAGLLDQAQLASSDLALTMVTNMADWVVRNVNSASVQVWFGLFSIVTCWSQFFHLLRVVVDDAGRRPLATSAWYGVGWYERSDVQHLRANWKQLVSWMLIVLTLYNYTHTCIRLLKFAHIVYLQLLGCRAKIQPLVMVSSARSRSGWPRGKPCQYPYSGNYWEYGRLRAHCQRNRSGNCRWIFPGSLGIHLINCFVDICVFSAWDCHVFLLGRHIESLVGYWWIQRRRALANCSSNGRQSQRQHWRILHAVQYFEGPTIFSWTDIHWTLKQLLKCAMMTCRFWFQVARHLLQWTANSSLGDFYERALLNGIVGNQNQKASPNMTQFIYMLPLGGGGNWVEHFSPPASWHVLVWLWF